jgi:uncharacterized phage-associated protein
MLRFQFDEKKGVEALTYVASKWPEITAFFAAKVLFFAEKSHLNRYGRPIVADTFIAMPNGPVPSTIYDFINGELGIVRIGLRRQPREQVVKSRQNDFGGHSSADLCR